MYKVLKVGDTVRWMRPLDNDYRYGKVISIRDSYVNIKGIGVYSYVTAEVHIKYVDKVAGGKHYGGGKRDT